MKTKYKKLSSGRYETIIEGQAVTITREHSFVWLGAGTDQLVKRWRWEYRPRGAWSTVSRGGYTTRHRAVLAAQAWMQKQNKGAANG